jgi:hypothetical protein
MNGFDKENFVRSTERKNSKNRPSLLRGWLKTHIAQVLVLVLMVSSMPAPAKADFTDKSGSLPGIVSEKTVAIAGVAAGAAIGLLIFYVVKKRRGGTTVKLETPPVKINDFVPGQPTKQTIPVTNIMSAPVTVKAVTVDDKSGALAIGDARQGSFTLAPGEKFEIPVTLTANNGGGKARVRIVVATEKTKKDEVRFVEVSYGHTKSKLAKLIP